MNLLHLGRNDRQLHALLQQSQQWQRLAAQIKTYLPANLAAHCHIVCLDGSTLVVFADNNMVASRLRMILPGLVPQLQSVCTGVESFRVKIQPKLNTLPRHQPHLFSHHALDSFEQAAARVEHHPELAEALARFARKRQASD